MVIVERDECKCMVGMDTRKVYPVMASEYRVVQEIGHGMSATVYEAECIPLQETVAIKSIDLERVNANLEDIRREAQTMSLVEHPNVLRAHCSFIVQHHLWVVMPFMAAGSCRSIMQDHPCFSKGFQEPVIGVILKDTLKALHYLHHHGHIHRDVKAGNILIDSKGAVKLADFGVSASLFESGAHRHKRNTFVGTPCWMAPEVIDHDHGYDHKADIWSLGITALELAHGHAPFSQLPPIKALLMQLQGTPPALDFNFSKSFREMVGLCLLKDPARRPSADKLLKHSFFRHTKTPDYIVKHVLENLPRLAERLNIIKHKENLKLQHQDGDDDDDEEEEQDHAAMPHIRRISGWNFNEDNLQFEPMFRPSHDKTTALSAKDGLGSDSGFDAMDENHNQKMAKTAQIPDIDCETETHKKTDCEPHKPDAVPSGNAYSNLTSSKEESECGDADRNQSFNTELNSCVDSGPIVMAGCVNSQPPADKQHCAKEPCEYIQMEASQQSNIKENDIHSQRHAHLELKQEAAGDLINKAAANGAEEINHRGQGGTAHGLKLGTIQKKGRFSVTQENGVTNPNNKPFVHHPLPPLRRMHSLSSSQPSLSSAASGLVSPSKKWSPHEFNSHTSSMTVPIHSLLPHLQSILQSTLIQQDTVLQVLNEMGVLVGPHHHSSSTTTRHKSASERESEHMQKMNDLQAKVSALLDEVNAIKDKNAQMEHQLNVLSNRDRDRDMDMDENASVLP